MGLHLTVDRKDARSLLLGLLSFELLLVGLYVILPGIQIPRLFRLFDLDVEGNIPAWFSSLQLFMIGFLLILATRRDSAPPPTSTFLILSGLVFIFLSMDEAAAIHEQISTVIGRPDWLPSFRGKRGYWIPIYFVILGGLLIAARQNLIVCWTHFRHETTWMLVGMAVFLMGAAGLEALAYEFLLQDFKPLNPAVYRVEVIGEEFLEMSGASLMLYAVLLFILRDSSNGTDSDT